MTVKIFIHHKIVDERKSKKKETVKNYKQSLSKNLTISITIVVVYSNVSHTSSQLIGLIITERSS